MDTLIFRPGADLIKAPSEAPTRAPAILRSCRHRPAGPRWLHPAVHYLRAHVQVSAWQAPVIGLNVRHTDGRGRGHDGDEQEENGSGAHSSSGASDSYDLVKCGGE